MSSPKAIRPSLPRSESTRSADAATDPGVSQSRTRPLTSEDGFRRRGATRGRRATPELQTPLLRRRSSSLPAHPLTPADIELASLSQKDARDPSVNTTREAIDALKRERTTARAEALDAALAALPQRKSMLPLRRRALQAAARAIMDKALEVLEAGITQHSEGTPVPDGVFREAGNARTLNQVASLEPGQSAATKLADRWPAYLGASEPRIKEAAALAKRVAGLADVGLIITHTRTPTSYPVSMAPTPAGEQPLYLTPWARDEGPVGLQLAERLARCAAKYPALDGHEGDLNQRLPAIRSLDVVQNMDAQMNPPDALNLAAPRFKIYTTAEVTVLRDAAGMKAEWEACTVLSRVVRLLDTAFPDEQGAAGTRWHGRRRETRV